MTIQFPHFAPTPLTQKTLAEKPSIQFGKATEDKAEFSKKADPLSKESLVRQLLQPDNTSTVKKLVLKELLTPDDKNTESQQAQHTLRVLRDYLRENPNKKEFLNEEMTLELILLAFEEMASSSTISDYTPGIFDEPLESMYLEQLLTQTTAHKILFTQLKHLRDAAQLDGDMAKSIHERLGELELYRGAGAMWGDGWILENYRIAGVTPSEDVLDLLLEKTRRYDKITQQYEGPMFDEPAETRYLQAALKNSTSMDYVVEIIEIEAAKSKEERTDTYLAAVEALIKQVNLIDQGNPEANRWPWDRAETALEKLNALSPKIQDEILIDPLKTTANLPEEEKEALQAAFRKSKKKVARLNEVREYIKEEAEKAKASEKEAAEKAEQDAANSAKNPFKKAGRFIQSKIKREKTANKETEASAESK